MKEALNDKIQSISLWVVIMAFVLYLAFLLILSVLNPELEYIKKHPWYFLTESLLVPTFTSAPFVLFVIHRKIKWRQSVIFIGSVWLKILLLHLLLEFSGFYKWFVKALSTENN